MGVGKQMAGTAPGIGFADRLLAWFEKAGRHDLPWQQDRSLYRVWVSEVMLQQTQVQTVIPYFERFMARFPTVQALASAAEDEVLHFWSGLGYYARARNLHAAARRVVSERGGDLPLEREQWNALPGVGRSTAGAILAQALDQRHAILDGNVRRVLARWAAIEGAPGRPEVEARLWQLSEHLTPAVRAADYTQAIMDLGATLCTRTRPRCDACPVRADCVARQEGRQALLPTPRKVRHRPERRVHWLVLENAGSVLLSRRPARGGVELDPRRQALAARHDFRARGGGLVVGWELKYGRTERAVLSWLPQGCGRRSVRRCRPPRSASSHLNWRFRRRTR